MVEAGIGAIIQAYNQTPTPFKLDTHQRHPHKSSKHSCLNGRVSNPKFTIVRFLALLMKVFSMFVVCVCVCGVRVCVCVCEHV